MPMFTKLIKNQFEVGARGNENSYFCFGTRKRKKEAYSKPRLISAFRTVGCSYKILFEHWGAGADPKLAPRSRAVDKGGTYKPSLIKCYFIENGRHISNRVCQASYRVARGATAPSWRGSKPLNTQINISTLRTDLWVVLLSRQSSYSCLKVSMSELTLKLVRRMNCNLLYLSWIECYPLVKLNWVAPVWFDGVAKCRRRSSTDSQS